MKCENLIQTIGAACPSAMHPDASKSGCYVLKIRHWQPLGGVLLGNCLPGLACFLAKLSALPGNNVVGR